MADAHRRPRRADALAGLLPHKLLHQAVFQRVIADDDQPSFETQYVHRLPQTLLQVLQLLVHGYPERLEGLGGRVYLAPPGHHLLDELGKLAGCPERPLPDDAAEQAADQIEAQLRSGGATEVDSSEIGKLAMDKLRALDQIAYIRFASVYQSFEDIETLKREVDNLYAQRESGANVK